MYANTVETMLAKQDIHDAMMRYARGIDRGDAVLLQSAYWEDAVEVHGSAYNGPAIPYLKGAAQRVTDNGTTMQHFIANMHIEFDGDDTAWVESYVLTFARFAKDGEDWDTLTGARSYDKFVRRGGEWRILHRRVAFDWNHDIKSAESWALGVFDPDSPDMFMGKKGRRDLSYVRD
jgi:hypothetical protein